jgi:threonine/homoserine/homoserine lactone efflux protein
LNTALLVTYASTVLLLIATPGPVVALVLAAATRHGARQAWMTALGSNAASLILIAVAAWAIVAGAALDPAWLMGLSLAGCLYVGYLGIETVRGGLAPAPAPDAPAASLDRQAPARSSGLQQGFLVGLCNPKDILFFVAFFAQFLQVTDAFGTSLAVLTGLWVLIDLSVLGLYIALARRLASVRHVRCVSLISGSALLLIALLGLLHNLHAGWGQAS